MNNIILYTSHLRKEVTQRLLTMDNKSKNCIPTYGRQTVPNWDKNGKNGFEKYNVQATETVSIITSGCNNKKKKL